MLYINWSYKGCVVQDNCIKDLDNDTTGITKAVILIENKVINKPENYDKYFFTSRELTDKEKLRGRIDYD